MDTIRIGNRDIGTGKPCYIIAEAGVNHGGSIDTALRMIDVAAQAGADAVKFQHYIVRNSVSVNTPLAEYMNRTVPDFANMADLIRQYEFDISDFAKLKAHCKEVGITFLCTPFDEVAADQLVDIGIEAFKIPSGEIDNLAYLRHIAVYHRPMIMSTGMSDLWEVGRAVATIESEGNHDIALLHCVSNYPAEAYDCNLLAIDTMRQAFGYAVGFSDHTKGNAIAFAAVALGACIIEKHFTLDKSLPGPDHQASASPDELTALVQGIRRVASALGNGVKRMRHNEINTREVARKSIVARRSIAKGEPLTFDNLAVKRPGTGIEPPALPFLVGRVARRDIAEDELITPEILV